MRIVVLKEVKRANGLCLQKCRWDWPNAEPSEGYRFVWRDAKTNRLKPRRGQTYLPSGAEILTLLGKAMKAGWLDK